MFIDTLLIHSTIVKVQPSPPQLCFMLQGEALEVFLGRKLLHFNLFPNCLLFTGRKNTNCRIYKWLPTTLEYDASKVAAVLIHCHMHTVGKDHKA